MSEEKIMEHLPVLAREVVEFLSCGNTPCRVIDGTLGNGGHSRLLLEANANMRLLGIDRDARALERAERNLADFGDRVTLAHGRFSQLAEIAADCAWDQADAILLDVGVSSPQIDDPKSGFSWRFDGPLDMRMDQSSPTTAASLLNHSSEEKLRDIFHFYGEIPQAGKLARRLVEIRQVRPFSTTGELVEAIEKVLGRSRPGRPPSPTLVFQALRIAVNDELGELESALPAAFGLLKPGGRMGVISFHSLEDRIVKRFFRAGSAQCVCPPGLPVCMCHHRPELLELTRKALTAREDELAANRRSAPAKLRVAEKL